MALWNRMKWLVFGFLAISIGLYPIIYFIVDRHFGLLSTKSELLLSSASWNTGFYGHIIFGGLALLIGWLQFSERFRTNSMRRHRIIGKVYTISVLISSICGLYIAQDATGGWVSEFGFSILAIIWFTVTVMAYIEAKQGRIKKHQLYMILSYAACFAAVTLRIWLPILTSITGDFDSAYQMVAWLCWVPNLLFAFVIIKRQQLLG